MTARLAAPVVALGLLGCGLQSTSGVAWSGERAPRVPVTVGVTTQAFRETHAVVGIRAVALMEDGFELRSGLAHVGGDIVRERSRWAFELGGDFGAGGPVRPVYSGIGGYVGASGNVRLRLCGVADQQPAYDLVFGAIDLVLEPRAGLWMAPAERHEGTTYGDATLEIGLRFSIGSDVLATKQGIPPDAPTEGTTR